MRSTEVIKISNFRAYKYTELLKIKSILQNSKKNDTSMKSDTVPAAYKYKVTIYFVVRKLKAAVVDAKLSMHGLIQSPLDILFSSNHNIHKSLCGLYFWASDPLIDRFYYDLLLKRSEAQKQKPYELL